MSKNATKIRQLATLAMLSAVIVVLQTVGSGIRIGPFGLTLVLIPVVIGAALYGPIGGGVLGGVFGVMATIGCINGADLGGAMVFAANPVICVILVMLKGILAGMAAGWIYRLFAKKNSYLAMLFAAAICPIVNTAIFLLGMFTLFPGVLEIWAEGGNVFLYALTGIVLVNFVPELLINILVSPASQRVIHAVRGKNR